MSISALDSHEVKQLAIAYVTAHDDVSKMSMTEFVERCDEVITELLKAADAK